MNINFAQLAFFIIFIILLIGLSVAGYFVIKSDWSYVAKAGSIAGFVLFMGLFATIAYNLTG